MRPVRSAAILIVVDGELSSVVVSLGDGEELEEKIGWSFGDLRIAICAFGHVGVKRGVVRKVYFVDVLASTEI